MTAMKRMLDTTMAASQAAFNGTKLMASDGALLVPSYEPANHAGGNSGPRTRLTTVRSVGLESNRDIWGDCQSPQKRLESSTPRLSSLRQSRAIAAKTAH